MLSSVRATPPENPLYLKRRVLPMSRSQQACLTAGGYSGRLPIPRKDETKASAMSASNLNDVSVRVYGVLTEVRVSKEEIDTQDSIVSTAVC